MMIESKAGCQLVVIESKADYQLMMIFQLNKEVERACILLLTNQDPSFFFGISLWAGVIRVCNWALFGWALDPALREKSTKQTPRNEI